LPDDDDDIPCTPRDIQRAVTEARGLAEPADAIRRGLV
jgi:hypothetical protein